MIRVCSNGGCKQPATRRGRCDKHQSAAVKRKAQAHEVHGSNTVYNSSKWKRLRELKIQKNPICELCQTIDKITHAAEIDHWIEIQETKQLTWDLENLVSLCAACHRQKTGMVKQLREKNKNKLMHFLMDHKPTEMSDYHKDVLRQITKAV